MTRRAVRATALLSAPFPGFRHCYSPLDAPSRLTWRGLIFGFVCVDCLHNLKCQSERRAIFEESSSHIARSMKYMPAIARRLHHSRDIGEPFDFLTWFEYAPQHVGAFEELVAELRATEEWRFVVREVDIRLSR
jgi:hypothetical protein